MEQGGAVVRSEAGFGELGWRGGVEWVWDRSWVGMGGGTAGMGGGTAGVGGGGGGRAGGSVLCTQQVAVQCVVRVAAKHWASGLQGTVEGTVGRGGGGR